jgi:hypothetical protein
MFMIGHEQEWAARCCGCESESARACKKKQKRVEGWKKKRTRKAKQKRTEQRKNDIDTTMDGRRSALARVSRKTNQL